MAPVGALQSSRDDMATEPEDSLSHLVGNIPRCSSDATETRPLLSDNSLRNWSTTLSGSPESLVEDVARAAATTAPPLVGIEDVSEALTKALLGAAEAPVAERERPGRTLDDLVVIVRAADERAPTTGLSEKVFMKLAERCISLQFAEAVKAGECAARVATSTADFSTSLAMARVLVCDVVYALGPSAPNVCVAVVAAIWKVWQHSAPRAEVGPLFSDCCSTSETNDPLPRDALESSILRTLETCFARADSGEGLSSDICQFKEEVRRLCDSWSTHVEEKEGWAALLGETVSDPDGDVALRNRLSLGLESRRVGPAVAYDRMLASVVWPFVSSILLQPDRTSQPDAHSADARDMRVITNPDLASSRAVLAVGPVICALEPEEDERVEWGIKCIEERLVALLVTPDLPSAVRCAVAEVLVSRLLSLGVVSGGDSSRRDGFRPKAQGASRVSISHALGQWDASQSLEAKQALSEATRAALSRLNPKPLTCAGVE